MTHEGLEVTGTLERADAMHGDRHLSKPRQPAAAADAASAGAPRGGCMSD